MRGFFFYKLALIFFLITLVIRFVDFFCCRLWLPFESYFIINQVSRKSFKISVQHNLLNLLPKFNRNSQVKLCTVSSTAWTIKVRLVHESQFRKWVSKWSIDEIPYVASFTHKSNTQLTVSKTNILVGFRT